MTFKEFLERRARAAGVALELPTIEQLDAERRRKKMNDNDLNDAIKWAAKAAGLAALGTLALALFVWLL